MTVRHREGRSASELCERSVDGGKQEKITVATAGREGSNRHGLLAVIDGSNGHSREG